MSKIISVLCISFSLFISSIPGFGGGGVSAGCSIGGIGVGGFGGGGGFGSGGGGGAGPCGVSPGVGMSGFGGGSGFGVPKLNLTPWMDYHFTPTSSEASSNTDEVRPTRPEPKHETYHIQRVWKDISKRIGKTDPDIDDAIKELDETVLDPDLDIDGSGSLHRRNYFNKTYALIENTTDSYQSYVEDVENLYLQDPSEINRQKKDLIPFFKGMIVEGVRTLNKELKNHKDFFNDPHTAYDLLNITEQLLDMALGFVPGVSTLKDLHEVVFGVNAITGEKLTPEQRALSLLSVASMGTVGNTLKTIKHITNVFEKMKQLKIMKGLNKVIKSLNEDILKLQKPKTYETVGKKFSKEVSEAIRWLHKDDYINKKVNDPKDVENRRNDLKFIMDGFEKGTTKIKKAPESGVEGYRYYDDIKSYEKGRWITNKDFDISDLQKKQDVARTLDLPENIDVSQLKKVKVRIPENTEYLSGIVKKQFRENAGGGYQMFVKDPSVLEVVK